MKQHIQINQNAAMELMMAGLESFTEGRLEGNKSKPVETYAHLWGYRRYLDNNEKVIHIVDHVSVSVLAKRRQRSVTPVPEVLKLKSGIAEFLRPELTLLGDFHTHPYVSDKQVKTIKGWQYSPDDESSLIGDNDLWRMSCSNPIMLILAICKMSRVRKSDQSRLQKNVLCFNVAEYKFWLAAYAAEENESSGRYVKSATRSDVSISFLPLETWNDSGERLAHYANCNSSEAVYHDEIIPS